MSYRDKIKHVLSEDETRLREKDEEYGGSWLKRGGIGAYMMAARKIDRLENIVSGYQYDIFAALTNDKSGESLLDTIRDLRGYLTLIEAEYVNRTIHKRMIDILTRASESVIMQASGSVAVPIVTDPNLEKEEIHVVPTDGFELLDAIGDAAHVSHCLFEDTELPKCDIPDADGRCPSAMNNCPRSKKDGIPYSSDEDQTKSTKIK
jgi:hypothetical protein